MFRGKPVLEAGENDARLLKPIAQYGKNKDRALLLLHGFSSSPAVYRLMLPALTGYDAIVAPTLAGHGDSIAAFSQSTAKQWIESAETACANLIDNYRHVDVLGLSLGGLLACHLSARFPLNRLYLLAPALRIKSSIPFALHLARTMRFLGFHLLRNQAGNICMEGRAELTYRQLPIPATIEILTLIRDFDFKQPTCPTDLFLGKWDEVVDSKAVADMFLKNPNVTTHWLKKSAHILPLDNDVNTILDVVNK